MKKHGWRLLLLSGIFSVCFAGVAFALNASMGAPCDKPDHWKIAHENEKAACFYACPGSDKKLPMTCTSTECSSGIFSKDCYHLSGEKLYGGGSWDATVSSQAGASAVDAKNCATAVTSSVTQASIVSACSP